jgi:hypothetical protein
LPAEIGFAKKWMKDELIPRSARRKKPKAAERAPQSPKRSGPRRLKRKEII